MVTIKNQQEISLMREGGKRLKDILDKLLDKAKPGIPTAFLDQLAGEMVVKAGGQPSFKTVGGYRFTTCMCVNDEVVHGIPDDILKEGDILCIDIGILYKGFHTDMAFTILVGGKKEGKTDKFLETGKKALSLAIREAREGNRVGHISRTIQTIVEGAGYSVVRSLVGHGIGRSLHEDPQIPGFLEAPIEATLKLKRGMTLAIEVIYNEGKSEVVYKNDDGWTIVTKDKSRSAVFEKTLVVTDKGPVILT